MGCLCTVGIRSVGGILPPLVHLSYRFHRLPLGLLNFLVCYQVLGSGEVHLFPSLYLSRSIPICGAHIESPIPLYFQKQRLGKSNFLYILDDVTYDSDVGNPLITYNRYLSSFLNFFLSLVEFDVPGKVGKILNKFCKIRQYYPRTTLLKLFI